jgi:hypothetical protein
MPVPAPCEARPQKKTKFRINNVLQASYHYDAMG